MDLELREMIIIRRYYKFIIFTSQEDKIKIMNLLIIEVEYSKYAIKKDL